MLGFLVSEEDRASRFLGVSGLTPEALRAGASDPAFLAGVMDYVLADQSLLLAFAESADIPPDRAVAARRQLPGAVE